MLNVLDVSQNFGGRVLFDGVTVAFSPGRRYGLTGPNGAGKSTFMKFLAGDADPAKGSVARPKKTSILRQDQSAYDEHRVLDVVLMGNARLWQAMAEKAALLARCEAGEELTEEMGMRLGELEGVVAEEDGYVADVEAAKLLDGLGIPVELHDGPMRELSGGFKLRVLLARALFGKPDCLLLDEPTNHLDLDSIRWLEQFLCAYEGILVVISHDRHFMNAVATHIADIDYETIIVYPGNYDDMVMQKSQVRGRIESENADKQKKIDQLKDFIARFGAGTRASQVQSRKKEIDKLAVTELRKSNIQRPYIRFELGNRPPSGKHVLRVEGLSKTFVQAGKADIPIVKDLHLTLMRGERMAVIGPSGIGKTTLLRLLLGEVQKDAGEVVWGHEVRVGYFAQEHGGVLPKGVRLWEYLASVDEGKGPDRASKEELRNLLGRMLFSGDEGEKLTDVLSGGETARVLFAKMMLLKHNVLVFDEPTNHLDLESISALSWAIERFEGTVIFVTHDRDLVSSCATRVLAMSKHGIEDWKGGYDEFLARHQDVRLDR